MGLTISKPKQLLVEGRDAEAFLHPFIESMGIDDLQIHDYGGISELGAFLKQFVLTSGYRQRLVTVIGIVRDAEQNVGDAFKSICSALKKVNLPYPRAPLIFTNQNPKVGVYLFPDGKNNGMIETLLLKAACTQC